MKIEITDYPIDRKISRVIIEFENSDSYVQEVPEIAPKAQKISETLSELPKVEIKKEASIAPKVQIPDTEPNTEIPSEMTDLEF